MDVRPHITAAVLAAAAIYAPTASASLVFSDDFEDIGASPSGFSFNVFQDGGSVASGGSPVNTYGGFIGSGGTAQIVVAEEGNAGVGGGGGIRMTLETFATNDSTGGIAFFGWTYEDAAVFSGTVNAADVEALTLSFDYKTVLGGDYSARVERVGGDFNNRVDLGVLPNTGGLFQTASFDLSAANPGQIANLVGAINSSADPSILQLVIGNAGDPNAYQHTSTIALDNLAISAIPEPSAPFLVFAATVAGAANRRRRASGA